MTFLCGPNGAVPAADLGPADRAALAEFEQFLRDAHREEETLTDKKDQAPPPVDLDDIAGWVQADRDLTAQILAAEARVEQLRAELQLDQLTEARGKVRAKIQDALGDAHEGRVGGVPVVRWKPNKAAPYFDSKRFKADHPELAEQYKAFKKAARPYVLLNPPGGA